MGIDAEIQPRRLGDLIANGAVGIEAMHRHMAGLIVSDQGEVTAMGDAHVNGPHRQSTRRAMRRQRPVIRHAKSAEGMAVTRVAGACGAAGLAVARRHIENFPGRMRPAILNIGGQLGHAAGRERSLRDIQAIDRQIRPDAVIEGQKRGRLRLGVAGKPPLRQAGLRNRAGRARYFLSWCCWREPNAARQAPEIARSAPFIACIWAKFPLALDIRRLETSR